MSNEQCLSLYYACTAKTPHFKITFAWLLSWLTICHSQKRHCRKNCHSALTTWCFETLAKGQNCLLERHHTMHSLKLWTCKGPQNASLFKRLLPHSLTNARFSSTSAFVSMPQRLSNFVCKPWYVTWALFWVLLYRRSPSSYFAANYHAGYLHVLKIYKKNAARN